ncbi:UNVERIFIED_CONTAM: hypothetical protein DV094_12060 [Bifidobacterium longum subsp. infantis]|nr:DUF3820 family protein [Bifidobacterium longum]MED7620884.1 hypothetical protein [Bifidobacterium longum subsp. infantis]
MNHEDRESWSPDACPSQYKDRLIADLPGPYLNWLARRDFPRDEIAQTTVRRPLFTELRLKIDVCAER